MKQKSFADLGVAAKTSTAFFQNIAALPVFLLATLPLQQGIADEMRYKTKNQEKKQEMMPGYNQSARLLEKESWDVFFGGNFIYWMASEDGLTIGRRIPLNRATTTPTLNEKILYQEFEFKPGFQVYAGFGTSSMDDWIFYGKWTRLHQTTNTSFAFNDNDIETQTWITRINTTYRANKVNSSWGLQLDLLDFVWSRPFYSGTQVTVSPLLGIRAGWIDQQFDLTYSFSNAVPMNGAFSSDSWSLGPLVGFETNWRLGYGFSVLGKASGSILYTSYTKINLYEEITLQTLAARDVNATYGPYKAVRPNAEIGLGVAWGTYFYNKYHFDLAVTYDFNVFWNQNVLRGVADNYSYTVSEAAAASLTLQGPTFQASFDF